jgi:DNA-binding Xre family transcriptional regulator
MDSNNTHDHAMATKKLKFICNLDEILTARGISKGDLTAGAGISTASTYKFSSGGRIDRIDRGVTEKIVEYLQCSFEDLWTITYE